ncbi:MAG: peptide chain release factor N(5)-glutamine methyltransferase [Deltaproteobacteria bacterium]|nr:peptide chain release factor N(5)-glutamine methyltransferase [Deltaproteobacteria bacterium]
MTAPAPKAWTIVELLRWAADYFREKGVSEPRTSAEVLLAHALGLSRLDLYLRHDQPLTPEELARFKNLVLRRRQGEPVAYIIGHKEFWSLDFIVTPAVLIPRPETEILVQAVLDVLKTEDRRPKTGDRGLDVGTGSGAVVITLARELPGMRWLAVDVSRPALNVARENARRHGAAARISLVQASLLSSIKPEPRFSMVVANLPYIPRPVWEGLPKDIKEFEPREALLGGEDGTDLLKALIGQAHQVLLPGGWLALEVADGMAPKVAQLITETTAYGPPEILKDYQGADRVVRARRRD